MIHFTTTKTTPTGWIVTNHFTQSDDGIVSSLKDTAGKPVKDMVEVATLPKDVQKGLADGTLKYE